MASKTQVLISVSCVLLYILTICESYPTKQKLESPGKETTCGFQSCAKVDPQKLNVHLVPHTHDDVGWLKTVDQYYYGSNSGYQMAGVQYILDTVVDALMDNPNRRFVYVETAFFWKWWLQQSEARRQQVKELVNAGRLEFIGGAWSMNDEAAAHYQSTIDQFAWGLRKLNDTFGACGRPTIGWQIDAFGHSREMASLFAQMGFNGVFFARLDYQDKDKRLSTNTAEVIWEGSANLGGAADLFTHALYNHYSAPSGFCFDILCSFEPFIDNKRSPDYNVDEKVKAFVEFVKEQAKYYTSNNIILTMGDDFNYMDAYMYFLNMDKLIKYVNSASSEVNVMYSTPSCYLKAVNDEGLSYATKQDDFFPYATDAQTFWTGFYTSRPTSKRFERMCNNFLQVGKQLEAVAHLGATGASQLDSLRETLGVMQHHDAITGTEKEHVANDYARMMTNSMEDARKSAQVSLSKLMAGGAEELPLSHCIQLNVSKCEVSEQQDKFVVTVYNPFSRSVNHYVRVPVSEASYKVQDPKGAEVYSEILPVPAHLQQAPERENQGATHELVFRAENLPALGFRSYYVSKLSSSFQAIEPSNENFIGSEDNVLVQLDETSGLVKEIIIAGERIPLDQNYFYYESASGLSSDSYVFRPVQSGPKSVANSATYKTYKGDLVEEIHQQFSDWMTQVIRLYKTEGYVEFDWLVGPVPTSEDNIGKEVISRFTTNLATDSLFYTDSNGRQLLERKRDFRPTWDVDLTAEPVAGNYYPVTSMISMRDSKTGIEVAVLTDRAQGGSSLNDGQIELMVHRRLTENNNGMVEALNEQAYGVGLYVRGKHYLLAGNRNGDSPNIAVQERDLAARMIQAPWLFFTPAEVGFSEWQNKYKMEYSGLSKGLPINVQILTLEPWRDQELLLRLEHIMEKNEDAEYSKPVDINLDGLFTSLAIQEVREVTLDGNMWVEDMKRLVWKSKNKRTDDGMKPQRNLPTVTLNPMEIKTFLIKVTSQ